ncbi:MAG: VCBS repeat-containing protein, partial [Bacteroidales bacterium]|nr:VCBS repeat-containing protein [Bacteroidales bacterium]
MRQTKFLWVIIFCCFLGHAIQAQYRINNQDDESLKHAWAGGLDACQFGRMDLDGDGKQDLLVFDRRGNRLLTYLNKGSHGEIDYDLAPQYVSFFPDFDEWVIFVDYDRDGFEDIFTYSKGWAGIKVYRHLGTFPPEFELVVSPYLTSFQGGGYVNILATNADYPALTDVDGDGDLDLLSFWSLGTFIELHTNLSIELYGHADSLVYERTDFCWGRVAENEETNEMYLDTCLFNREILASERTLRHRGATFGVKDLN